MNEIQNILSEFINQVRPAFGNVFWKAIVYGSYARGDYNENSDLDIMILTTMTDDEILKIEDAVFDVAFEMELQYGINISVIIKNEEHFKYWMDVLPFYRNVEMEGVLVGES